MGHRAEVLILDDEAIVGERLKHHLEKSDLQVEIFTDSAQALARLSEKDFDVVITDLKMKGADGLDVLHFVRNQGKGTQVILITGFASIEAAREAEYGSAFDFVTKPFQLETIARLTQKAVRKARKLRTGARGGQ